MSSYSITCSKITVGALKEAIANLADDWLVMVPSMNRKPGEFIDADHIYVDLSDHTVSLDGAISEGPGVLNSVEHDVSPTGRVLEPLHGRPKKWASQPPVTKSFSSGISGSAHTMGAALNKGVQDLKLGLERHVRYLSFEHRDLQLHLGTMTKATALAALPLRSLAGDTRNIKGLVPKPKKHYEILGLKKRKGGHRGY